MTVAVGTTITLTRVANGYTLRLGGGLLTQSIASAQYYPQPDATEYVAGEDDLFDVIKLMLVNCNLSA